MEKDAVHRNKKLIEALSLSVVCQIFLPYVSCRLSSHLIAPSVSMRHFVTLAVLVLLYAFIADKLQGVLNMVSIDNGLCKAACLLRGGSAITPYKKSALSKSLNDLYLRPRNKGAKQIQKFGQYNHAPFICLSWHIKILSR